MSAIIGALRVVLGADTAAFEEGMAKAKQKTSSFGVDIGKAAAIVGVAVAGMATAIGFGIKRTIDEADKLGKMAQSIGIPVEDLSRLKHAADLSGIGMDQLSASVGRLAKGMADIAAGGTGPAAQAFQTLGISVQNVDGTLRSSSEVMTDVAAKFANMEDGSTKTALAMGIFGKAGKDMIPLLNSGATGLKEMMTEADQLGIVIDSNTAKASERFNDNLTRLARVKDGIITLITARMVPALASMTDFLVKAAKESDIVRIASIALSTVLEGLARVVKFVFDNLSTLVRVLATFIAIQIAQVVANAGLAFVKFASAIQLATVATTALNVAKSLTIGKIVAFGALVAWATGNLDTMRDALGQVATKVGELAAKFAPDAMGFVTTTLQQLGLDTKALTDDFGAFKTGTDAANNALKNYNPTLVNTKAQADALKQSQKDLNAAQREATQVYEATRTPIERMQVEIGKLDQLLAMNLITWDTHQRGVQKIAEAEGATWGQAGESMAGSFARISQSFGQESKSMATAAKGFSIVQAIISAYTGAAKALELPFPANLAAAAGVLAQGLGFVASIKSQSIPSFQKGGAFRIPGGIGGGDTRMVPIMGEPGELVTVTPNDQQGGARGGGIRTIVVEGLDAAKFYSGKAVRQLIGALNEEVRNGARLQVA